jgi:ferric iron reductase protein FhuF
MTKLTNDQIRQLNSYSVYINHPQHPLFTLYDLLDNEKTEDCIRTVQTVSGSPNMTVAASFFMRRLGMFINMQLYNLAAYDEIWDGDTTKICIGAIEEYGNRTVSTFVEESDWHVIDENEHRDVIRKILLQADKVIRQIRTVISVSPLTLWENIFGFLLWQYHVMLSDPSMTKEARHDLDILKDNETWNGIARHSLFAKYLKGSEPSELLNTTVRTTCCFSKDVPGLMQCGFCPLKN